MKFAMLADEWYPVLSLEPESDAYRPGDVVEATFDEWTDYVLAANLFEESQQRLAEIDKQRNTR